MRRISLHQNHAPEAGPRKHDLRATSYSVPMLIDDGTARWAKICLRQSCIQRRHRRYDRLDIKELRDEELRDEELRLAVGP